jgi:hypothetical protein
MKKKAVDAVLNDGEEGQGKGLERAWWQIVHRLCYVR